MKNKLKRLKELRRISQNGDNRTMETKVWSDAPHHYAIRVGSEAEVLHKNRKDKDSSSS